MVATLAGVLRAGRLAQLVEHLVYTERVGGSSPSLPTRAARILRASQLAALALVALLMPRSRTGPRGRAHDIPDHAASAPSTASAATNAPR